MATSETTAHQVAHGLLALAHAQGEAGAEGASEAPAAPAPISAAAAQSTAAAPATAVSAPASAAATGSLAAASAAPSLSHAQTAPGLNPPITPSSTFNTLTTTTAAAAAPTANATTGWPLNPLLQGTQAHHYRGPLSAQQVMECLASDISLNARRALTGQHAGYLKFFHYLGRFPPSDLSVTRKRAAHARVRVAASAQTSSSTAASPSASSSTGAGASASTPAVDPSALTPVPGERDLQERWRCRVCAVDLQVPPEKVSNLGSHLFGTSARQGCVNIRGDTPAEPIPDLDRDENGKIVRSTANYRRRPSSKRPRSPSVDDGVDADGSVDNDHAEVDELTRASKQPTVGLSNGFSYASRSDAPAMASGSSSAISAPAGPYPSRSPPANGHLTTQANGATSLAANSAAEPNLLPPYAANAASAALAAAASTSAPVTATNGDIPTTFALALDPAGHIIAATPTFPLVTGIPIRLARLTSINNFLHESQEKVFAGFRSTFADFLRPPSNGSVAHTDDARDTSSFGRLPEGWETTTINPALTGSLPLRFLSLKKTRAAPTEVQGEGGYYDIYNVRLHVSAADALTQSCPLVCTFVRADGFPSIAGQAPL
ncbi:hypothetical protein V8E36_007742 [Tilletia maclaganii]